VTFATVEGAHPTHVEEISDAFARQQPLTHRIGMGATVRGRLIRPSVGSGKVGVLAPSRNRRLIGEHPVLPEADGFFEIQGLPPGACTLRFSPQSGFQDLGSFSTWTDLDPPLMELDLKEGETREVQLDASHLVLRSLRGRLRLPVGCGTVQSVRLALLHEGPAAARVGIRSCGSFPVSPAREFQASDR
jgi:hypothetical protein